MDRATRARVDSLLFEARSWAGREHPAVDELARRYQLDPLVVQRILESEGIEVERTEQIDAPAKSASGRITALLSPEEIEAACRRAAGEEPD